MRTERVLALTTLVTLAACGGGQSVADSTAAATSAAAPAAGGSTSTPQPAAVAPSTVTAKPATGQTVAVGMIGDDKGYQFDPASVTVKAGDAVQWTNVSGGPHNVTFWADSVPDSGQLAANMPNTTGPMMGPLLTDPNATYPVSTAGLKPGVYHCYCTPHVAFGMKGTVTVQ